jgi:hypothetical protein
MKRALVFILICLLLGAFINTALSLWLLTRWPDLTKVSTPDVSLQGPALAGRTWPVRPPAAWPEPNVWWETRSFGLTHIDARQVGALKFSMDYIASGWPMTTLYYRQCWWPSDEPQWGAEEPAEIKCRPVLVGWLGNSGHLRWRTLRDRVLGAPGGAALPGREPQGSPSLPTLRLSERSIQRVQRVRRAGGRGGARGECRGVIAGDQERVKKTVVINSLLYAAAAVC